LTTPPRFTLQKNLHQIKSEIAQFSANEPENLLDSQKIRKVIFPAKISSSVGDPNEVNLHKMDSVRAKFSDNFL
jgi:hypothetical protein